MNSNFFETNSFFIDEKVNILKFENCYQVFNEKGEKIGSINQKLSLGQKLLRLLINKAMLPFKLEIKDANDNLISSINRGWNFFLSNITVKDSKDVTIGFIKQKFSFLKPTFKIFDTSENLLAVINGDWKAWDFAIKNAEDHTIGTINKKWAGAMKEIFTTADKYNVKIDSAFSNQMVKIIVVSGAITIDMVLKERK
jgi:uncharacterized protein YxjI